MKKTTTIALTALFAITGFALYCQTALAATLVGPIDDSAHWDLSGSPYLITGEVVVAEGATLTIDPGVIVKFSEASDLLVNGNLDAVGSAGNTIQFTSAKNDQLGGDDNGDGRDSLPSKDDYWWITVRGPHAKIGQVDISYTSKGLALEATPDLASNISAHDVGMAITTTASNATFSSLNISNAGNGLSISGGQASVTDSVISGIGQGIGINVGGGSLTLANSTTTSFVSGINLANNARLTMTDIVVMHNIDGIRINAPIVLSRGTPAIAPAITGSQNSIADNSGHGVNNKTAVDYDFRNNWWGDPSGPFHATNTEGKGNSVTDHVNFNPWLVAPPGAVDLPTCCSNVAFIPGIESSRLYKQQTFENELWVPNRNADVDKLFMTSAGEGADPTIYTRDIINSSFSIPVYSSFISYMDSLAKSKTINRWEALPYDWRLDPRTVVERGDAQPDGTISYTSPVSGSTTPFMIREIGALAKDAQNGKVTIVTHSNGGLVVKALIEKLESMKEGGQGNLIDSIDKIIMVAAPETGTPQGLAALLHGDGQTIFGGLFLDMSTARQFAENMPGAYGLLPSAMYVNNNPVPLVQFSPSVDSVGNYRKVYGDTIASYPALKQFLTTGRAKPAATDVLTPNILNPTLLSNAEALHEIDSWIPPQGVQLIKVLGSGIDTLQGIRYDGLDLCPIPGCSLGKILDHSPVLASEGDGTVLVGSRVPSSNTYYIDLARSNSENNRNNKHKDILNVPELDGFIKNILTGNASVPAYISTTAPHSAAPRVIFSIHSPVDIQVVDRTGRRVGFSTSRSGSDIMTYEEAVPNSTYMKFGEGTYVSVPNDTYTATLKGKATGLFTFEIDSPNRTSIFKDVPVSSSTVATLAYDPAASSTLSVDNNGDGTIDQVIQDSVQLSPLELTALLGMTIKTLHLPKLLEAALLVETEAVKNLIIKNKSALVKAALVAMRLEIALEKDKKISAVDADGLMLIIQKIQSLL